MDRGASPIPPADIGSNINMEISRTFSRSGYGRAFRAARLASLRLAKKVSFALVFTVATVSVAQADVWVRESSLGAGLASGSLLLPVGTANYWAGFQNIEVSASSSGVSPTSFAAYCIDAFHFSTNVFNPDFTPSVTHSVTTVFASQLTDIRNLFNKFYAGTVGNAGNAAAFQLALWEIANDDKNIATGAVKVNGSTILALKETSGAGYTTTSADYLLNNLSYAGPDLYSLTLYQVNRAAGGVGQDYVVATPTVTLVPEPSTYAMLAIGLLAMGGIARRKLS
jgi:hypothetical protein